MSTSTTRKREESIIRRESAFVYTYVYICNVYIKLIYIAYRNGCSKAKTPIK